MNMLLLAGVLAGLFWLQKGKNNTVAGAQQTIGLLFFELLFLSFRALFVALFTFPDERKMLLKVHTIFFIVDCFWPSLQYVIGAMA